ncbi:hypothetical protein FKM82_020227 [Ascaphus truei]
MGLALVNREKFPMDTSATLWVGCSGKGGKHPTSSPNIRTLDYKPKGGNLGGRSEERVRRESLFVLIVAVFSCGVVYMSTPMSPCVCPPTLVPTDGANKRKVVGVRRNHKRGLDRTGVEQLRQMDQHISTNE